MRLLSGHLLLNSENLAHLLVKGKRIRDVAHLNVIVINNNPLLLETGTIDHLGNINVGDHLGHLQGAGDIGHLYHVVPPLETDTEDVGIRENGNIIVHVQGRILGHLVLLVNHQQLTLLHHHHHHHHLISRRIMK